MTEKVFPELVVANEPSTTNNFDKIDLEVNLWNEFLGNNKKLAQYVDNVTKNSLSLVDFLVLDIDLILINEWLREANIPFPERSSIVCLIHKYRLVWKNACLQKNNKTKKISSSWLIAARKELYDAQEKDQTFLTQEDSLIEMEKPEKKASDDEEDAEPKSVSIAAFIPFINIVYDFFFDETPSVEAMKETLNLLGVMGALIFTIVITIPLSFD